MSPPQGKIILQPRHNISRARKIADGLVSHLFTIDDSHSPVVECNYDQVSFDPEWLFRFTLDVFNRNGGMFAYMLPFFIHAWRARICVDVHTILI